MQVTLAFEEIVIIIGNRRCEPIKITTAIYGPTAWYDLENFIAKKLGDTNLDNVSPDTFIDVMIKSRSVEGLASRKLPMSGYNGTAAALDEIPGEFKDLVKTRSQAGAHLAVKAYRDMLEDIILHPAPVSLFYNN